MKRLLVGIQAFILAVLLSSLAFGATEIRKLGDRDLSWGSGTWVSTGGRTVYRINADIIPFSQDNAVKVGVLYPLAAAGNWKVPYTTGSGTWAGLSIGATGLCLKSGGTSAAPVWGVCGGGSSDYDPANVAITGGSISVTNSSAVSLGFTGEFHSVTGAITKTGYDTSQDWNWWNSYYSRSDRRFHFYTESDGTGGTTTDNTPMIQVKVNSAGTGNVPSAKILAAVYNYLLKVGHIDASGNLTVTGTVTAAKHATNTPSGYRHANITNDNDTLQWSPTEGDYYYSKSQGKFLFYNSSGQWVAFGTGAGSYIYSDDFNRANETPLGGAWSTILQAGDSLNLTDNQILVAGTTSYNQYAYRNSESYADNQWSQAKVKVNPLDVEVGGPTVRARSNGGDWNGYIASIMDNATIIVWVAYGNPLDWEQVGTSITGLTLTANDSIKISINGNVINVYENGVLIGTKTDTNNRVPSGGTAGIAILGQVTRWDDWSGGSN